MYGINEADWVPLTQVEHQLANLKPLGETPEVKMNPWHMVKHYKTPSRYAQEQIPYLSMTHSTNVTSRVWNDPSRRQMPTRFVPKSRGDESFPRLGRSLVTLAQFMPQN